MSAHILVHDSPAFLRCLRISRNDYRRSRTQDFKLDLDQKGKTESKTHLNLFLWYDLWESLTLIFLFMGKLLITCFIIPD